MGFVFLGVILPMGKNNLSALEYDRIKFFLGIKAKTEIGKWFCEKLKPSKKIECVKQMLLETREAIKLIAQKNNLPLENIEYINMIIKRVKLNGILSCDELFRISVFLEMTNKIKLYFEDYNGVLNNLILKINLLHDLKDELEKKIDMYSVKDYASLNLLDIRNKTKTLDIKIREELNNIILQSRNLLQDNVLYMKNNRYCLAVKREFKNHFDGIIHDQSISGATIFIEPKNIIELNNKTKKLLLDEQREIETILKDLSIKIKNNYKFLLRDIYALGKLDFIFAKAELAIEMQASEPILNESGYINLKKVRHPLIDKKKVVPLDIYLGKEFIMLLITGPNTGGKTVALKTVGLSTLMAQSGLYIPAEENSEVAVFDNIFIDIGDEQSIEQNLSTFSAHIKNISKIIKQANEKSLILLDELGAGTEPTEGAAIAISILEYFLELKSRVMVTSHYSELKIFAMTEKRAENASCEFDLKTLAPNYRLRIGTPGKSNAFEISKKIGLSENIILRAKKNLNTQNIVFEDVLKKIESIRLNLEEKEFELKKKLYKLEAEKKEFEAAREKFNCEREKIISLAKEKASKIISDTDEKSRLLLKKYRENKFKEAEKINHEIKEIKKSFVAEKTGKTVLKNNEILEKKNIVLGQTLFCISLGQNVIVKSLPDRNNMLNISIGNFLIKVNLNDLTVSDRKQKSDLKKKNIAIANKYYIAQKKIDISPEIDVHGCLCDEAIILIDKYLDDAILANLSQVKIIHGKGTGALKKAIYAYLRDNKYVKEFRSGEFGEGDFGVTIVKL